jgi:hypothetical protein
MYCIVQGYRVPMFMLFSSHKCGSNLDYAPWFDPHILDFLLHFLLHENWFFFHYLKIFLNNTITTMM